MLEASGLTGQEHLELVEGDLISKMGKKRPHVITVAALNTWLRMVFGERMVHTEAPIDVAPADNSSNEPEPDAIVLNQDYSAFLSANPQPRDLLLVVEVSDSTLKFDLTTKARLYARAGITEFWVLDIRGRRLIVHRDPAVGKYASVMEYGEREPASPLAAAAADFRAGDVLPPA